MLGEKTRLGRAIGEIVTELQSGYPWDADVDRAMREQGVYDVKLLSRVTRVAILQQHTTKSSDGSVPKPDMGSIMQCSAELGADAVAAMIESGLISVTYQSPRAGELYRSPQETVIMLNQMAVEDGWRNE